MGRPEIIKKEKIKKNTSRPTTEKKKAVIKGKGKRAAIKTKKYIKKLGKKVKKEFVDTAKLSWEGAKKDAKTIGKLVNVGEGFTKEMLGLKKGGPIRMNKGGAVDARKIAKKYFKGTF